MEPLVVSQRELYGRIVHTCENLKKTGAVKLSLALVQSARANLDKISGRGSKPSTTA